ncbi:hypothetical protein D3C80_869940 [compost metagenome]
MAGDRRPHGTAATGVFQHQGDHGLGGLERREGDEQGVVAVLHLGGGRVVDLVLFQAHHLGGTGFARRLVGGIGKGAAAGALVTVDDAPHAVLGHLPVGVALGGDGHVRVDGGVDHAVHRGGALEQVRRHVVTVLGQDADRLGELNWRGAPVALADTDGDGVPLIPGLTPARHLPVAGRHDPLGLFIEVDATVLTEAELGHVAVDLVDADPVGEIVEVGVRRHLDGAIDVEPAMTPAAPVTKLLGGARDGEAGATEVAIVGGDGPLVQPHHRHHGLDGGGGGIDALGGAVHQRARRIVEQRRVVGAGDAGHEQVGVVARARLHGQDGAGIGIHHDDGAPTTGQQLLCFKLQADVDVEVDVLAGLRRLELEGAHHPAAVVDLDLLVARHAVQLILVELLHPLLADVLGGGIVGELVLLVEALHVTGVDLGHIAQRMGQGIAKRIVALEIGLYAGARIVVLVDREEGDLILGQLLEQGHRLEAALALHLGQEPLLGPLRQGQQGDQLVGRLLQILGLFRHYLQAVDGAVLRQQHAVGVIDEAPWRCHRHDPDPVVVGTGLIGFVRLYLQIVEITQQHQHEDDHADVGYQGAPEEQTSLGTVIAHFDAILQHAVTLWLTCG